MSTYGDLYSMDDCDHYMCAKPLLNIANAFYVCYFKSYSKAPKKRVRPKGEWEGEKSRAQKQRGI